MKRFVLVPIFACLLFAAPASAATHHANGKVVVCRTLGIGTAYSVSTGGGTVSTVFGRCIDGTAREHVIQQ